MSIWTKIRDEIEHKNIDTAIREVKTFLRDSHACSDLILEDQFDNDESEIAFEIEDVLQSNNLTTVNISVANFTDTFNQWHFVVNAKDESLLDSEEDEFLEPNNTTIDTHITRIIVLDGLNRIKNQISNLFSQYIVDSKNLELKHQYEALSLLALLKFFKLIKKSVKNIKHTKKVKFQISEKYNDYLQLVLWFALLFAILKSIYYIIKFKIKSHELFF